MTQDATTLQLDTRVPKLHARNATEFRLAVMRERIAQGQTLDEIGEYLGIGRDRLRQLMKLGNLRPHPPSVCKGCQKSFMPHVRRQLYCTPKCKLFVPFERACGGCHKPFTATFADHKFCSDRCANLVHRHNCKRRNWTKAEPFQILTLPTDPQTCSHCGATYQARGYLQKYCSNRCKGRAANRRAAAKRQTVALPKVKPSRPATRPSCLPTFIHRAADRLPPAGKEVYAFLSPDSRAWRVRRLGLGAGSVWQLLPSHRLRSPDLKPFGYWVHAKDRARLDAYRSKRMQTTGDR